MVRNYKRTTDRGKWSEDHLRKAMDEVKNKGVSVLSASKKFGIPRKTLERRLKTGINVKLSLGRPPILPKDAEEKIALHLITLQERGFGVSKEMCKKLAFNLAEELGIKTTFSSTNGKAGDDWFVAFMNRNPKIRIRKAQGLSLDRAIGMQKEVVKDYFQLLLKTLEKFDFLHAPGKIYNMDETGMQLNNQGDHILAKKGAKNVHVITSSEKGETVTVVACCNAENNFLPPYCIFKGVHEKPEFSKDMPQGSVVKMSKKSSYITSEIFMDWFLNHFVPRKPSGKVLLIMDGHASHTNSLVIFKEAQKHDVEILILPSHCTQFLQPLDRSFFKPLKSYFKEAAKLHVRLNPNKKISRADFGGLSKKAWTKAIVNGAAGFKACGICPYDPDKILDSAFYTDSDSSNNTTTTDGPVSLNSTSDEIDSSSGSGTTGKTNSSSDSGVPEIDLPMDFTEPLITSSPISAGPSSRISLPDSAAPSSKISSPHSASPSSKKISPKTVSPKKISPRKVLNKILPCPQVITPISKRKKRVAELITDQENYDKIVEKKANIEKEAAEKQKKREEALKKKEMKNKKALEKQTKNTNLKKQKTKRETSKGNESSAGGSKKQSLRQNLFLNNRTPSQDQLVEDKTRCIFCDEPYSNSKSREEWVCCNMCERWAHSLCTDCSNIGFYVCEMCRVI